MKLTSENYYSQEANKEYMSVSQFKDFAGTYGKMPCEFEALEKLNADIRLSIFGDGNYDGICWIVSIENIQNIDENVIVLMMPQGEWLEFMHGNG